MRRLRVWLTVAVAVLTGGAVLLAALPPVLGWYVARRVSALTGQPVTIADVDLNLFTGRIAMSGLRIGPAGDPLATLGRLSGRIRPGPVLRGRLSFEELRLDAPRVRVVRTAPEAFNVTPVLERIRARPAAEPVPLTVDHLTLEDGAVIVEDRVLVPARAWRADAIELQARGITSERGVARGTASGRLALAGAPVTVDADQIGLVPARARLRVTVTDLDLRPLAAYMPADAAVSLAGGRLTTAHQAQYDAEHGLRASGEGTIRDLALRRAGQAPPFATAPVVRLRSRDLALKDGRAWAGRLELRADPSVLDASLSPPRRYDLRDFAVLVEGVEYPSPSPARVAVAATLPEGGQATLRGTAAVAPAAVDAVLRVSGLDLARLRPYLPAASPVMLTGGRLALALDLRYGGGAPFTVDGDVSATGVVLHRRGQTEPFITHRRLHGVLAGLRLGNGVALERLTLTGAPTIVDASVAPPQRFEVPALSLTVEDVTWPSRGPARVRGTARLHGGAGAALEGRLDPGTLGVRATVRLAGVDLARFRAYLPADGPVALERGRASATVRIAHDRATGIRIDGDGAVADVALARPGAAAPVVTGSRLAFAVTDLRVGNGGLSARRLHLAGAPAVVPPRTETARPVELRSLSLDVEGLTWPATRPADTRLAVDLPEAGRLEVRGRVHPGTRRLDLAIDLAGAALGPWSAFAPFEAPLGGLLDGMLTAAGTLGESSPLAVRGALTGRALTLGSGDPPAIAVERLDVAGVEARWPGRVDIDRIRLARPTVLLERREDGTLPLLASLSRRPDTQPSASPGPRPAERGAPAAPEEPPLGLPFAVREIVVDGGEGRFIDRTTRPFYSEELTDLGATVHGLTSGKGARAEVALHGVVGAQAALWLNGVTAPFGEPFFLEVSGELRRFAVPRTNPYLRQFLAWIARSGELSTQLHYRVVGDELQGANEIVVQRLAVERARAEGQDVGRLLGLPLAVIVSLLKNPNGDIHLSVPVSGQLGSPQFGFGDAILTALRNVVTRVVTGPLAAVGRLVRGGKEGGGEEVLEVEPLSFEPGSAVVSPERERQLQRVADFLRSAPYVRLAMRPLVTDADVRALKVQAVVARIQRAEQDRPQDGFAGAAAHVFGERFPGRPVPATSEAIVAALSEAEPLPGEASRRLAERRLDAVRRVLVQQAGIEPGRLQAGPVPPPAGGAGAPRIEFTLQPA